MQEQIKHLLNCNEKTLLDQSQLNFHYFSKIFSQFLFFFFFSAEVVKGNKRNLLITLWFNV